jgi:hypothetical protein
MDKKQESRLSMYLAVRDFLLQNSGTTKDLPNFEANFKDLQSAISDIQSIAEVQKSNQKGFTEEKRLLREKLTEMVLDASNKMNAFASFSGDIKLQQAVKMTRTRLMRSPDTGLRDYAQIIFDNAESKIDSLVQYGITKESQTEMVDYINRYNASISGPRVAQTGKVQATKHIADLFQHADLLIDALSAAIGIIKLAQPLFSKGFDTAKKVVFTSGRTVALRGVAISKGGNPIKGAKFVFRPDTATLNLGAPGEIMKMTAEKGIFRIKSIQEGTYNVTVTKPGFRDKVVSVVVADGELTELRVELEAA